MANRDKHLDAGPEEDNSHSGSAGHRKSYRTPVVEQFGRLNRITQGSFNVGSDGAFGMTKNPGGGMNTGFRQTMDMGTGM